MVPQDTTSSVPAGPDRVSSGLSVSPPREGVAHVEIAGTPIALEFDADGSIISPISCADK